MRRGVLRAARAVTDLPDLGFAQRRSATLAERPHGVMHAPPSSVVIALAALVAGAAALVYAQTTRPGKFAGAGEVPAPDVALAAPSRAPRGNKHARAAGSSLRFQPRCRTR